MGFAEGALGVLLVGKENQLDTSQAAGVLGGTEHHGVLCGFVIGLKAEAALEINYLLDHAGGSDRVVLLPVVIFVITEHSDRMYWVIIIVYERVTQNSSEKEKR